MDLVPGPGPHIYLSPHFDDIALSCGGLAAQTGGLCLTLFAAPPPAGEPFSAYAQRLHDRWGEPDPQAGNLLRRAEERAAMGLLGLDLALLTYPDAIYRHGRYGSHDDIFGRIHPAEADLPADLAADLESHLRARGCAPPAAVYAPLGLGHHVDHQLAYLAAGLLAGRGWAVRYYEDFPYAANPQAHAARFAELGAPPDAAPRSGEGRGERFVPAYVPLDRTIEGKIAAIAAYGSQISSLFAGPAAMPQAVRDYATAVAATWRAESGAGRPAEPPSAHYAERYWRRGGV